MKGAHEYPDQDNEQRLDRFEKRLYTFYIVGVSVLCVAIVSLLWHGYTKYTNTILIGNIDSQFPYRYDVVVYNGNAEAITYHATSAYKHAGVTYVTLTNGDEVVIKNKRYVEILSVENE